jgi:tripeptide aminopeptidase
MLIALGMRRVYHRKHSQSYHVSFPLQKSELLDLAEKMSLIEETWLAQGHDYIKEQMFYHLLEQLLAKGVFKKKSELRTVLRDIERKNFVGRLETKSV